MVLTVNLVCKMQIVFPENLFMRLDKYYTQDIRKVIVILQPVIERTMERVCIIYQCRLYTTKYDKVEFVQSDT